MAGEPAGRIETREQLARTSIRQAWHQLAVASGATPPPSAPSDHPDPACAALDIAARHLGIELARRPQNADANQSPLQAFARLNGVGLRDVRLAGSWWHRDSGTLIGWERATQEPVALLPLAGRGYRLVRPLSGSSAIVDGAIAGQLAPRAFLVYRPLPTRALKVRSLLAFTLRGARRDATTIVIAGMLTAATAAALPPTVDFLFENAVPRSAIDQIAVVIGGIALCALSAGCFELTQAMTLLRIEGKAEMALQPALLSRLLGLPVSFFRKFSAGELTNRVLSTQRMRRILAECAITATLGAITVVTSFLLVLMYSPIMCLLSAILAAVSGAITAGLAYAKLRQERAYATLSGQEDSLLVEMMEGIAKLRCAAAEERIFGRWARVFARQKRHFIQAQRFAGYAEMFGDALPILATLVLFYAASLMIGHGDEGQPTLGLGTFLAIRAAFGQLFGAMVSVNRAMAAALELVPMFERLQPILASEPEARPEKIEVSELSGRIEVRNLVFRYASDTAPVLDNISLTVAPGDYVALVGPSGSGKSSLIRLLLGFERAESGDILYDGHSVHALDMTSLRRRIGVVLQHARLSAGTVFDNITSGLPYTLDEAWAAAEMAGVARDIEAMPMSMHTMLLDGGATLSGGQRQRLMIARAIIGRPQILFFDEATSALDNITQALVTRSLERLGATRIVAAHRLSTIRQADQIFVLERGRIVEAGNFSRLMTESGLFARMANRQLL